MRVLDLFTGLGGWSLGLERTGGFQTVAACDIRPEARQRIARHWPHVPIYEDVRTLTADRLRADGVTVDVICGGFPCEDLSRAGPQSGLDGSRSGLWSEIARLTGELRPRYVLVENVADLLRGPAERPGEWFGRVLGDLAALGYDAEWHCIPASYLGAPHIRDRVWIVAEPQHPDAHGERRDPAAQHERRPQLHDGQGREPQSLRGDVPPRASYAPHIIANRTTDWAAEPDVDRMADGIPDLVERIELLGRAVVPQIPELIGRAILHARAA